MQWDTELELRVLQAIDEHQGPPSFGHTHLLKIIGDDRYVEATQHVKRLYDGGYVTASTPPRMTLQSGSYGFILGGLTGEGRQRLEALRAQHDADG